MQLHSARPLKVGLVIALLLFVAVVAGAGVYFRQYYAVSVFLAWLLIETILWRQQSLRRFMLPQGSVSAIPFLLSLYRPADAVSEARLARKIASLKLEGALNENERRVVERLKDLSELRALTFADPTRVGAGLRHAFCYSTGLAGLEPLFEGKTVALEDITSASTAIADLYWKLFESCLGDLPELTRLAQNLYQDLFGRSFEAGAAREHIEKLTDSMLRDGGVPYLVLNLVRQGRIADARAIARELLTGEIELEEEARSALYWCAEIVWFCREKSLLLVDFESCIRHLYHLCFTNPERAGFLEIDSRFFSQFETVNEMAREGFLFKETLFEKVLALWGEHEGLFDPVFQSVLEAMSQSHNKIYGERKNWESLWKREQEAFSREYLYVIEGNLSYLAGHYEDALRFYERALEYQPKLRAARLNRLFCVARLGNHELHEQLALGIAADKSLWPSGPMVAGNSYLLVRDRASMERFYGYLDREPAWARKARYYQSIFCYENGLYEEALEFALAAHEQNPRDPSVSYHLSLCYNAVGEKDRALDVVKGMSRPEKGDWLDYYRFTLERDIGRGAEASETLRKIPVEYFQDPDELAEAVEFARNQKDLALLRHLRHSLKD